MSEDRKEVEPVERHLIHTCAACKKELYREPIPNNWPKTGIEKRDGGDIITHMICPVCTKKLYPEYCGE